MKGLVGFSKVKSLTSQIYLPFSISISHCTSHKLLQKLLSTRTAFSFSGARNQLMSLETTCWDYLGSVDMKACMGWPVLMMWLRRMMQGGGVSIYWVWGMLYIVYRAERVYSKRWLVNYWLVMRVSNAFLIYAAISISIINTHDLTKYVQSIVSQGYFTNNNFLVLMLVAQMFVILSRIHIINVDYDHHSYHHIKLLKLAQQMENLKKVVSKSCQFQSQKKIPHNQQLRRAFSSYCLLLQGKGCHNNARNNFCQQIFPLENIYQSLKHPMAQRMALSKKILIPSIHHPQPAQRYHKDMEEFKTSIDSKLYITPNRESRPLGLPFSRGFNEATNDQRFQPSFDNFSLSSMFANRILSESELAEFKKDRSNNVQVFQTPARKRNEGYGGRQTEQASRVLQSEAKKSRPKQKGLRQLSQRAYEIVLTLRSASYKQVANKLVDELNNEKDSDEHILRGRIEEKDEQNIKRRVYDALNVLIALGVLRKQGRKIVGDRSIKLKFQQSDRKTLSAQIQAKQREIAKKKQILKKEALKAQCWHMIIQQNQARAQECGKINIPFMIVNASPKGIVKTETDNEGLCNRIQIHQKGNQNDLMKMDLDCYADYKMDLFRKT